MLQTAMKGGVMRAKREWAGAREQWERRGVEEWSGVECRLLVMVVAVDAHR